MKERKDSLYPPDWQKYARRDWHRIYTMVKDNYIEAAAFFLQQALEKFVKVFLIDALLDDAVKYKPALESFRKVCKRVLALGSPAVALRPPSNDC